MEDSRKEKRENDFFSNPNLTDIKRKREKYLVSLRKKKRYQIFMEKRKIITREPNQEFSEGLRLYESLEEQNQKDLTLLGITPEDFGDEGFEKVISTFCSSTDPEVLEASIRILDNFVKGMIETNRAQEYVCELRDDLLEKYAEILQLDGHLRLKYNVLCFVINLTGITAEYTPKFYKKYEETSFTKILCEIITQEIDQVDAKISLKTCKVASVALWVIRHLICDQRIRESFLKNNIFGKLPLGSLECPSETTITEISTSIFQILDTLTLNLDEDYFYSLFEEFLPILTTTIQKICNDNSLTLRDILFSPQNAHPTKSQSEAFLAHKDEEDKESNPSSSQKFYTSTDIDKQVNKNAPEDFAYDLRIVVLKIVTQVTSLSSHFIDLLMGEIPSLPEETIKVIREKDKGISFLGLKLAGDMCMYTGKHEDISLRITKAGLVEELSHVLDTYSDVVDVVKEALWTFSNLCSTSTTTFNEILEHDYAGLLECICKILAKTLEPRIIHEGMHCIKKLVAFRNKTVCDVLVECDINNILKEVIKLPSLAPRTLSLCLESLYILFEISRGVSLAGNDYARKFYEVQGVEVLEDLALKTVSTKNTQLAEKIIEEFFRIPE
ncbi:unnamed protein product [Moneuplotes crassus]|uniref:Uncharacterized protein n=1 Tax=Euplotes crassus TaxID=5936 RepID=A0AAD1U9X7_EUPCR|nr:unnamed protein product [Moneuplotes crassus]